ncbi:MAG: ABC transporter ATP-binding protein [Candidatus Pacebacteria bacterium]|nr:ABC transporter ATP-binding protein [Candidatus Paceibacterota bacterium]
MSVILEVKNISKSYTQGKEIITVLKDVSLSVEKGQKVAIVGPSGSGKSTLLSIMAGLDNGDKGDVIIDGQKIATMSEVDLSTLRNRKISIIFQSFELVGFFNALENITLPLAIRGDKDADKKGRALLKSMNLEGRSKNLPSELSGGEQQRVAIGRALASGSDIIFADEPTGNLDSRNGHVILDLFLNAAKEHEKTLIIITHDMSIARRMDKVYEIKDNTLVDSTGLV